MKKLIYLTLILFFVNAKNLNAQCGNPPTISGAIIDTAKCGQHTGSIYPYGLQNGTPPYTYQWYSGSMLLSGETSLPIYGLSSGTYSILVTDANGCIATGVTTFTVPATAQVLSSFSMNSNHGSIPLVVSFTNQSIGATSYYWNFGDGTNSTSLNPSHTYTAVGTYTASLIASNGSCVNTMYSVIIAQTVGIQQFKNAEQLLMVYPNPTSNQFFIDANTNGKLTLGLYDVNGRQVLNTDVNDKSVINTEGLNEGVYTLSIKTPDAVVNKKLVIVR